MSSSSGGIGGPPNFFNCGNESNSLSFQLLLVRRHQTTIGKVFSNKNILVENIEYSTIPVHRDQARALNIHPKLHYEVQSLGQNAQ
ncbi:hypothetical protein [Bradyrhizobium sp. AUGA SZCCT0182]|uniref:hypothetical protein n=1 Tax=Bradyrhizobium sp. AUGA SZCCT0182 TaxID=2807667 RepID=UPI001BA49857|nr:hypothetical protein [Bradyrhizobium sp. AUGA SZCCT0182]MBR1234749.1 hypothetical protein [Bradyrhizobium sp. AUGA SZCCT0182]